MAYTPTKEHRERIANALRGKKRSQEFKDKVSKSKKGISTSPNTQFKRGHIRGLQKGHTPWNYIDGKSGKRFRPSKMVNGKKKKISHLVWFSQSDNLPYLPKGFCIHHLDLNPSNNKINNLIMLPNDYHDKLHKEISRLRR